MAYAVMQDQVEELPPDMLKHAFAAIPGLTILDGINMAEHSLGILAQGMTIEDATAFQNVLLAENIQVEVVDERNIIKLPAPQTANRLDCLPEMLVAYDSLNRPVQLSWSNVVMLGAGKVELSETQTVKEDVLERKGYRRKKKVTTYTSHKEEFNLRMVLEIFLDVAPGRYVMRADKFQYSYLGDRLRMNDSERNYVAVVKDAMAYASDASLNLGAQVIEEDEYSMFQYSSKTAFEREIAWHFWNGQRG